MGRVCSHSWARLYRLYGTWSLGGWRSASWLLKVLNTGVWVLSTWNGCRRQSQETGVRLCGPPMPGERPFLGPDAAGQGVHPHPDCASKQYYPAQAV